jgi:hypothetical protein
MDYTNLQVQTPIGIGVFDIRNAAAATIRGSKWRIRHGSAAASKPGATWPGSTPPTINTSPSTTQCHRRRVGQPVEQRPEWAGRLWIEWTGDIGHSRRLSISPTRRRSRRCSTHRSTTDIQRQGPYGLLGARVEYGPAIAGGLSARTRNLTNTDYVTATFGTPPRACRTSGTLASVRREFTVQR